ncbi:hypothetical protein O181_017424 [Austropuccinia psidii MF-1]|uniref:Uncharacterized protein n=1 Tax=Austropuccinia psidii MF-1 TaxID=1389203 RepID=A0A9Q3C5P9_9BASI|nr:hypothetical protein [Austropuccinia psidii MF-1]
MPKFASPFGKAISNFNTKRGLDINRNRNENIIQDYFNENEDVQDQYLNEERRNEVTAKKAKFKNRLENKSSHYQSPGKISRQSSAIDFTSSKPQAA